MSAIVLIAFVLLQLNFIFALPTSCSECSPFGLAGSEKWCGCCALDCGGFQQACVNDGYCVDKCASYGVCSGKLPMGGSAGMTLSAGEYAYFGPLTFPGRCTFTGLRLIGSTGNWGNTIPGFDVFLFTQAQFDKYKMGNIVSGGTSVTYAPFTITQTRVTAADNTENERTYQGSMTDLILDNFLDNNADQPYYIVLDNRDKGGRTPPQDGTVTLAWDEFQFTSTTPRLLQQPCDTRTLNPGKGQYALTKLPVGSLHARFSAEGAGVKAYIFDSNALAQFEADQGFTVGLGNVECVADQLCTTTAMSGGGAYSFVAHVPSGNPVKITAIFGANAQTGSCGTVSKVTTTTTTTAKFATTPEAPTTTSTTKATTERSIAATTPQPPPTTTTTTTASTQLSTGAPVTTRVSTSSDGAACGACEGGFGVAGTLKWCQCCQANCGGLLAGCRTQGFCADSGLCTTFPGICASGTAVPSTAPQASTLTTQQATVLTSAVHSTVDVVQSASSTVECAAGKAGCACLDNECLTDLVCMDDVCVAVQESVTGANVIGLSATTLLATIIYWLVQ